jgi:hypothetical protein
MAFQLAGMAFQLARAPFRAVRGATAERDFMGGAARRL